ncbi:MAG: DEAD/DEAH box helicase family protein [Candidatus Poribacteria bacterium]|nr:DEAD/DEAH box helicase family protein [Candidatus Poribacteria bacterium]
MALYQEYETKILTEKGINIQNDGIKEIIQLYDPEQALQLPVEPLERIQDFLDDYNELIGQTFKLRYYQVLALLFTECFFANRQQSDGFDPNSEQENQRMLAYWMATGSGKTHIMHLNILQYLHHFCKKDNTRLQIFLTTPLANLIKQHERELEPYVRRLNETYNNRIELTIDTTQGLLQKEDDYFQLPDSGEVRRLILVDEAHIGLTSQQSGKFRELRNRLNVGDSFLFEYSATFHNVAKELKDEYNNAIIYRYDYARFYTDGYGKDHFFKPIAADTVASESDEEIKDNLDECLRVMEEKLQIFNSVQKDEQYDDDLTVHRPLMAFMGHTVENPKEEGKDDEVSDIQKVLDYLAALNETERQKFRSIFGGAIIGPLVVARNPDNNSELLLSYGDGEKWGMINVGDGAGFHSSIENPRIETRVESIADPNLHFENLDNETSPINVLIGSRKFAEGWNSYRLSVIDLINLGSSKGNLIIQIFGRGVRLRGKGGDGKRRHIDHKPDYYLLRQRDREDDIRRLETLTVFSLRQTYLKRFLEEVHAGGVSFQYVFKIQVNPMLFKIDSSTSIDFEKYRHTLPIFKQGKTIGSGIKRVKFNGSEIHYTYFDGSTEQSRIMNNWRKLSLDYRTDKGKNALNVYEDLKENNEKYACYLNRAKLASLIHREAEKSQLQLYNKENYEPTIINFLSLIGEIRYREQGQDPITWTDQLNRQIVIDATRMLRNRINAHINRANYVYEPLERDDFIYEYTVTKEFPTQDELDAFVKRVENAETDALQENPHSQLRNKLQLLLPRGHRHIYEPLMRPQEEVENEHRDVKVSPDRLNAGEKKFVENLTEYIKLHYRQNERYEFYLMRNAQKIGIYLESDAGSYYPDFVLWVLDIQQDITHILFIDPKGERDITGGTRADYKNHPKVKLARKSEDETLVTLEKQLEAKVGRKFCLNSFLLLRDSSELGKGEPVKWIEENMAPYNILRLNWHGRTENCSTSQRLNDEKSYLDLMFEKIGIR